MASADVAIGPVAENVSDAVVAPLLWAALLAQHPEYDQSDGLAVVRSYLDAGNVDAVTEKLLDAYIASLPKDKQEAMLKLKERALRGEDSNPLVTTPENPA